jgi:hypothetical protein
MDTGEMSLRVLVDKWLGPDVAMTVHVMEFSRTTSDRRRYVRVGAFRREGFLQSSSFGMVTGRGTSFQQRPICRRCVPAGLRRERHEQMRHIPVHISFGKLNILELARDAGLLVVIDGKIGCTEYRSVHGSLDAFQRFVHALESALAKEQMRAGASTPRRRIH